MTISQRLHHSKTHRTGFDPNCPACLKDIGIPGIITHLKQCAEQNEADVRSDDEDTWAKAQAAEQRRVIEILKMYRRVKGL